MTSTGVEVATEETEEVSKVFIPINCNLNCSSQSIACCKISPLPKQLVQRQQVAGVVNRV